MTERNMATRTATVDFVRTLAKAEAAANQERWNSAAPLWQLVVEANPVVGRFWHQLADARYQLEEYATARQAWAEALALGEGFPGEMTYQMACCEARLDRPDEALAELERALALGFRHLDMARDDDAFTALRSDARFRELVGLVDSDAMSRDDGWRYDLRFFAREVKRRAYDPFRHAPESTFDTAFKELSDAVPHLTDLQIVAGLMKLLRPLGDGHARIIPPKTWEDARQTLPLQFYLFEEGLFITAASVAHRDLLGTQVHRFDSRPIAEMLMEIDPLLSRDNEQWPKEIAPPRLRQLPLLHALGLIDDPHQVALTVTGPDGRNRTVSVATETLPPEKPRDKPYTCPPGWLFFPETLAEPLPRYLRNAALSYWFDHLPDERTVYVQFNQVRDDPQEPFVDFTRRLFGFLDDQQVERLIIDIRWNDGGNTFLEMPFLHRLIGSRLNRRGSLFVIIGRRTFSAAQNFATLIDRHTEAIFAGEPTGSSPTFIGETVEFELPYSRVQANVSDLLWQSSWPMDYRTWLPPTLYTPPTFAAYRTNRDPAMDAILASTEHLPGW
jgi:tetratricopeptide (TPR) repeat protein